jgi:branched-subunit amino acid aminotransferase/4-amino-4-deoxychorismate lyase
MKPPAPGVQSIAYLNGEYLPLSEARLPVYDLGIIQGATITERLRTVRHWPYLVAEHLARLRNSSQLAGLRLPGNLDPLEEVIEQVAQRNSPLIPIEEDLAIVIFVTAGQALGESFGLAKTSRPSLCVHAAPLPFKQWGKAFRDGLQLVVSDIRQPPADVLNPRIKHRSRLHWFIADHRAREQAPGSMALLLDQRGYVTETASGNLVLVRNGELLTPGFEQTLAGISREHVRKLAARQGWRMREADLTPLDVAQADEAFLTSSTYCLLPVGSLDGKRIGNAVPGPVTKMLLDNWSEELGLDLERQILQAAGG